MSQLTRSLFQQDPTLLSSPVATKAASSSPLEDGKFKFDPSITSEDTITTPPGWDYLKNKAEPVKVRVEVKALSSVPYPYGVIHEHQHVLWGQVLTNQEIGRISHEKGRKGGGQYTDEVEAYTYELLHAEESGLSKLPEKIAGVWGNLNDEFWTLDAATQRAMRPKVLQALAQAQRFVRGTQVRLDPFARP
jgi:hypothetical protein